MPFMDINMASGGFPCIVAPIIVFLALCVETPLAASVPDAARWILAFSLAARRGALAVVVLVFGPCHYAEEAAPGTI